MMYTSRSKISRMLSEARELGIVEIRINEPWDRNETYEHEIQRKFGMQTVRVIRQRVADDEEEALKDISRATAFYAFYLDSILKPGMTVGISWGTTLYHITRRIRENNPKNIPVTVIPIMGAVMTGNPEKDSADLAKNLAVTRRSMYRAVRSATACCRTKASAAPWSWPERRMSSSLRSVRPRQNPGDTAWAARTAGS